jgi:hypothetical protein
MGLQRAFAEVQRLYTEIWIYVRTNVFRLWWYWESTEVVLKL